MKAVTFQDVERVRAENVPDPKLLDPRDAIVRVTHTAVCGSDLHVYHGRESGLDRGTIMGHEFVGEVLALGQDVTGLDVGTRVASPFTTSCGTCFYCRSGLTCRCTGGQLFGWVQDGHGLHGVQAEQVRVPHAAGTLVPLPTGLAPELALLAGDVLATGTFCAEQGGVSKDTVVAVVGCGPVGLCAIRAAKRLGAERVFAYDLLPERLAFAASLGAEPVDARRTDPVTPIHAFTEERGADVVLEVVGSPKATRLAFELVRPGGTLSAVGVHTEPHLAFSPGEAYDKNLTYRAGRCPARHYLPALLEELRGGADGLEKLFSHRMSLDDCSDAYALFAAREGGCTKILFEA